MVQSCLLSGRRAGPPKKILIRFDYPDSKELVRIKKTVVDNSDSDSFCIKSDIRIFFAPLVSFYYKQQAQCLEVMDIDLLNVHREF